MQLIFLDRYHAIPDGIRVKYPHVTLKRDTWNDYGFETLFVAKLFPTRDKKDAVSLGGVKIATRGLVASDPSMRSILTGERDGLDETFISLGQSEAYYTDLAKLTLDEQADYAKSMRDVVMLRIPEGELETEEVYRVSFLRSASAVEARDVGAKLFGLPEEALVQSFVYETHLTGAPAPHTIAFDFDADSQLPHRINVLVGVNGVGKTQLMANLAVLLSRFENKSVTVQRTGKGETFEDLGSLVPRPSVYGVIAVSFSAFDDFAIPSTKDMRDFHYAYCGLRTSENGTLSQADLARKIPRAIRKMDEAQANILREALRMVMPGRVLREALPVSRKLYAQLSAGQRIVINIVCDLVLNIRPRSLVLLDEPETHLHPQLLTSLLAILNDILLQYDSFAVIATHSPIVVQQVLAKRVAIVRRLADDLPNVGRPSTETFGENLTEIVRSVFDSVESDRDYQDVLDKLLAENDRDAAAVERLFGGKLGMNAQIYLHSVGRRKK